MDLGKGCKGKALQPRSELQLCTFQWLWVGENNSHGALKSLRFFSPMATAQKREWLEARPAVFCLRVCVCVHLHFDVIYWWKSREFWWWETIDMVVWFKPQTLGSEAVKPQVPCWGLTLGGNVLLLYDFALCKWSEDTNGIKWFGRCSKKHPKPSCCPWCAGESSL